MAEGGRADMILEIRNVLRRVQCKWAQLRGDVVVGEIRTSRYTPNGYRVTTYSAEEVDAIGLYCAELDKCYLLPMSLAAGRRGIHLRLAPCRNNQRQSIHWANQYELGAIAQLGERLAGSEEVAGSSPARASGCTVAAPFPPPCGRTRGCTAAGGTAGMHAAARRSCVRSRSSRREETCRLPRSRNYAWAGRSRLRYELVFVLC